MILEYLKRHLPVEVIYDKFLVSRQVGGVNFIGVHYHHQLFKGKVHQVASHIVNFAKPGMYNLVVGGHLHSLSVPIDSRMFRVQVLPSFYSGNDYNTQIGAYGTPQFTVFCPAYGYPEMHIKGVEN
jgi:hypothetical protein